MTRYVRFASQGHIAYGVREGDTIVELSGDLFQHTRTSKTYTVAQVKLLAPIVPHQIIAVGRNYRSHLGDLPVPTQPEVFFKPLSSIQDPDGPVVIPFDAKNLHYEAELVLVIGKRLRHASKEEAQAAIFGATCGNDLSERDWQRGEKKDVQWWRAKGSDTFSCFGPEIVSGLDYDNLRLQSRLNGEVMQDQTTADMLFDCATMVSFISRYMTIEPGDILYTGTPGQTKRMKDGDVVEVEVEGIGTLRNPVVAEKL